MIAPLHPVLGRPHLEFCVQFRLPWFNKDTDRLDRFRRDDPRAGEPDPAKKAEGHKPVLPEERAQRESHHCTAVLKGGCTGDEDSLLTRSHTEKTTATGTSCTGRSFISLEVF